MNVGCAARTTLRKIKSDETELILSLQPKYFFWREQWAQDLYSSCQLSELYIYSVDRTFATGALGAKIFATT